MDASDEGSVCPRRGKVSSSESSHVVSPTDRRKNKMPVEQDDGQVELVGDEFDSDLDPEDNEMIDSGTTQVEVRVEGGSRTITLLGNHDFLKDNKVVIYAFDSFCSNAEHKTLREFNDITFSKSIAGLALKVNLFLYFSLSLIFFVLRSSFTFTYFLCLCLQTVILELERM